MLIYLQNFKPNFALLFFQHHYLVQLAHSGEDCWIACNEQGGKCDWCGSEGWCCRKDWVGNGCDGLFGGSFHMCVLKPN